MRKDVERCPLLFIVLSARACLCPTTFERVAVRYTGSFRKISRTVPTFLSF